MTTGERPPVGDLAGLDGPVRTLFERIAAPAAGAPPDLGAIAAALVELAGDRDYIGRWVTTLGEASGGLAIHAPERGPRLLMVHRGEGQMGAVHDHGTWVAITPIVGLETHRHYRLAADGSDPGRVEVVETLALRPSDAATLLPPDDIHDHGHLAGQGEPAYILVMTGDDQVAFTRNEWDPVSGRHRVLRPGDRGRGLASQPWPGP
jgi:predicted metal-dependent enzyme (double-stranded beta helix superfamily)